MTAALPRADKGRCRKIAPEEIAEAIQTVLPAFHDKGRNLTAIYRACIEKGLFSPKQIARTTFGRIVKRYDLLEPESDASPKLRKAFAKPHANDLWQGDTLHGPWLHLDGRGNKPCQIFLICFIDDASRVIPHGGFYCSDNRTNPWPRGEAIDGIYFGAWGRKVTSATDGGGSLRVSSDAASAWPASGSKARWPSTIRTSTAVAPSQGR